MTLASHWQDLTDLTGGDEITVERVRLTNKDIAIEGSFDLPPLARLSAEDQVFIMAFVRSHGSIKQMERTFGISYPTVKKRLDSIAGQFEFVVSGPGAGGRRRALGGDRPAGPRRDIRTTTPSRGCRSHDDPTVDSARQGPGRR